MELSQGYKQTEVGVIPEDWEVRRLGDLGKLEMGKGLLKEDIFPYGDLPAIPYTSLYTDFTEVIDATRIKWFTSNEAPFVVNEPCVLLASSSNVSANTGKAGALVNGFPVAVGREVISLKASGSVSFISYLLSTPSYRRKTLNLAKGTTIKHVYPTTFLGYSIAFPPSSEQSVIAAALSDVDALLTTQNTLIAKQRAIKQGTMQELLTGKRRLPGFGGEWAAKRLGDFGVCHRGVGYDPSTDLFSSDSAESVRLLRANNVQESNVVLDGLQFVWNGRVSEHQYLRSGDVLICMANGSKELVGKAAQVSLSDGHEYTFGAFMGCYRPDQTEIDPTFVFYLFQTELYRRHLSILLAGSSINNLSPKSIEGLEVTIPRLREEQTAIAEVLGDMDAGIAELEVKRDKIARLKQGMTQELLTGRTRLI